jgi:hypothetical protein
MTCTCTMCLADAHRPKPARYLDQKFDREKFDLEVEKMMADMRVRRAGYRNAYDAATRTLSDVQYDANHDRERNGDGCPW